MLTAGAAHAPPVSHTSKQDGKFDRHESACRSSASLVPVCARPLSGASLLSRNASSALSVSVTLSFASPERLAPGVRLVAAPDAPGAASAATRKGLAMRALQSLFSAVFDTPGSGQDTRPARSARIRVHVCLYTLVGDNRLFLTRNERVTSWGCGRACSERLF